MSGTRQIKVFFLAISLMVICTGQAYGQRNHIVGPVTVDKILEQERIYDIYVNRYKPADEALNFLNSIEDSVQINVFFGTWCRESKKYVPRLIKTLQELSNQKIKAKYIGVDAQKKLPKEFLNMFEIKYIPTVVVLKGKKEVGRIEEIPQYRIETELVHILKGVQTEKNNQ